MNEKERRNYWQEICEQFAKTKKSKAAFCRDNNLSVGKFYHYLNLFKPDLIKKQSTTTKKITSFLPVKYKSEEIKQEIKIILKTGHTLSFEIMTEQIPAFISKMESSHESSL